MDKDSKILIVGHNDVIDKSLYHHLMTQGFNNVYSSSKIALNPTIQASVYDFFQKNRPEYVFLTSIRSGGIEANQKFSAEFMYQNLESQNNILYAAQKFGAKKLLNISASCVYPRDCPQPMKEEYLLTGPLESTSEPYSIAKIAGIKLCESFKRQYGFNAISVVPPTVYGPGSDTDPEKAHVMGALIAKFFQAVEDGQDEVVVWGSGQARREFLFADDLVNAVMFLMERYDENRFMNAGSGTDISIKELSEMIAEVTGFKGKITFDRFKPDGAYQKLLDNSRITKLGWKAKVGLKEGLGKTYQWYKSFKQGVLI